MRKIGDLFAELGFNPESSTDAQKAFIKHLIKAAEQTEPKRALENEAVEKKRGRVLAPEPLTQAIAQTKVEPQQLEFNFNESDSPKKVS